MSSTLHVALNKCSAIVANRSLRSLRSLQLYGCINSLVCVVTLVWTLFINWLIYLFVYLFNLFLLMIWFALSQGQNNGKVVPREPQGGDVTWTGDGFTEVKDNAALEYAVTNVPYTGEYNILVRYEPKVCDITSLLRGRYLCRHATLPSTCG